MKDSKYSMMDNGLMIKSTSTKDVGIYECMLKKHSVELKSKPAKMVLKYSESGCEYYYTK